MSGHGSIVAELRKYRRWIVVALVCAAAATAQSVAGESPTSQSLLFSAFEKNGQAVTILPDGRSLTLDSSSPSALVTAGADMLGTVPVVPPFVIPLAASRTGGSATVLPDGRVLIVGGKNADGALLATVEAIDITQNTSEVLPNISVLPRAYHTATLLTDGRVFIAGGVGASGRPMADAQLLDVRTNSIETLSSGLEIARYNHQAMLLSSGEALVWGGQTTSGQSAATGELFDPRVKALEGQVQSSDPRLLSSAIEAGQLPAIAETLPGADAADVMVDAQLAIRFNRPLPMERLNPSTIALVGPSGAVAGKVVGAERGMLAFFTPAQDLRPGAIYTLFVGGMTDKSGNIVPLTGIRFTTHRFVPDSLAPQQVLDLNLRAAPARANAGSPPPHKSMQRQSNGQLPKREAAKSADEKRKETAKDSDEAEDWVPQVENRRGPGSWRVLGLTHDPALHLQAVENLAGAPGQTAVTGRVLRLNGRPLEGISISSDGSTTTTDVYGRFLLSGLAAGTHQIKVDGTRIQSASRHYTVHFIQVDLSQGRTITTDTVYLPRVDPSAEISISSPADHEIILTHPDIPGLEVHIPKGAVLREYDGKIVTKLSITPIPVDRAPYPTPINFSVYFTLQPGGAFVDGDPNLAVKIVYPNYEGLAPGAPVDFWNYDPSSNGWRVYGRGKVSSDGKKITPDAATGFRQIMTFGFGIGGSGATPPPPQGPPPGGCVNGGDPVDCATGLFLHSNVDLFVNDVVPLAIQRTYRQNDSVSRAFGIGANLSYVMWLYTADTVTPYTYIDLVLSNGGRIRYLLQPGSPTIWKNTNSPTIFYGSVLTFDTATHSYLMTLKDKTVLSFTPHVPNQLQSITDRNGNVTNITLAGGNEVTQVTSPNGRYIVFTYDVSKRITAATDSSGRSVSYGYDASGRLATFTDANSKVESYSYDTANRMLTVTDRRSNTMVTNVYDANGRVSQQTLADNALWRFSYLTDAANNVTQTTVTDPRNYIRQDTFNASGYLTKEIVAMGQPEQQTYTFQRDAANLLLSVTDQLSRQTAFTYDGFGNVASVTPLSGTANAVTYQLGYDPIYHQLATFSDPLSHTTAIGYDANGNLMSVTDPLGHALALAHNSQGLPVSVMDALGHTTQIGYQGADLARITDALGRTGRVFTDAVGRIESLTDPLGNLTQYGYDARDQITSSTDPLNGITSLSYDPNGNLLTVTDARNVGQHGYSYDSRNRLYTYTDPLGHTETYNYDVMGNLTSKLDRKGQNTQYAYDALNRLHVVTYADASTITITWDAGNRPTTIADSVNGTLTRIYDGMDRLTEEKSPQGQVDYVYDTAGRRTQMTVSGHAQPVTYQYDNANRLTQIANGTTVVGIAYDAANRRSTVTYPNGIIKTYGFDAANELLSFNYDKGSTHIGDISYAYDVAGRQITQVGSGSFAKLQTSTLTNVTSTTFDAANRVTSINGTALGYDNNGNLTTSGADSYTWNVRNQLVATSQGAEAFQYDALGRRRAKNSNTTYVYDGWNSVTYNSSLLVTGPELDDIYAYLNSDGTTRSYIGDSLGSTLALTDSTGAITATYSYSPYGVPSEAGTDSTPRAFTGLEWESAPGLYYSRHRYYSPSLNRFISEDPIGLAGGVNTYAYTNGNPISFVDPTGRSPLGALVGGLLGGGYNVLVNAGKFGEPGGPTVLTAFVAGTLGGIAGGLIDNPAVAAGVSGALTAGITSYESGKSLSDSLAAAGVSALINATVGGVGGKALSAIGADEVTQFVGGTAAGILGSDIVNAVVPGADAAPVSSSCH